MKKVAFVIPWYGENISGGAETACRQIAENLKEAGMDIEILTTCVKDFRSDWNHNYYPEGIEIINEIPVRRFKVRKRNTKAFDEINYKFINNIAVTENEEQIFLKEMINSPSLYDYIKKEAQNYGSFIFIPYMFGTTYYGAMTVPDKSVLIPCFHNESYAYMKSFKKVFEKVKGMIFLSHPEQELAGKLFSLGNMKTAVLGVGIDTNYSVDENSFRQKYNIFDPFFLYAGRKDLGKNVPQLLEFFCKFKKNNPQNKHKLVLIGGGDIQIPTGFEHTIIDLGFVSPEDKANAYYAAELFILPSLNESFSIVIMESWSYGTPVLVHGDCSVTRDFCFRSNGGLFYSDYEEFNECINYLLNNFQEARILGIQGKKFVQDNFRWETVTQKYKDFITRLSV